MKTRRVVLEIALWLLFFLISSGLGYPALNRYDPRQALPDAAVYAQIATQGPALVNCHLRFRVLVSFPFAGRMPGCKRPYGNLGYADVLRESHVSIAID
jgi:hypothetical protein